MYLDSIFRDCGYDDRTFNLTEDIHIDEHEPDDAVERYHLNREEMRLLSEPLPTDLTTVQKDLLIVTAAYYGDIDRYSRLRRLDYLRGEMICCVRGIYHNTLSQSGGPNSRTRNEHLKQTWQSTHAS